MLMRAVMLIGLALVLGLSSGCVASRQVGRQTRESLLDAADGTERIVDQAGEDTRELIDDSGKVIDYLVKDSRKGIDKTGKKIEQLVADTRKEFRQAASWTRYQLTGER